MSTTDGAAIGQRLRTARQARQFTLAQLATLSGVPFSTIRVIEVGQTQSPRLGTMLALATALDVTETWLMWGDADAPGAPA